jgi:hypothetical protein
MAPTINSPAATLDRAKPRRAPRSVRDAATLGPFTCSSRTSDPMLDSSSLDTAPKLLTNGAGC